MEKRWFGLIGMLVLVWSVVSCASVSAALPAGRAYEMVSPIYKAGYGVGETLAVSPDGDSVAFGSMGGFDGILSGSGLGDNAYLAQRGSSGWSTSALQPPLGGVADFSANLEYVLANAPLGPNQAYVNFAGTEDEFLLRGVDAPNALASWEAFGGIAMKLLNEESFSVLEEGASPELCHVVVGGADGPLIDEARGTVGQIYDLSRGCDGEPPSLRLVGVKNRLGVRGEPEAINRACGTGLGLSGSYLGSQAGEEQEDSFNAIAADGREIYFTTNVEEVLDGRCDTDRQLFVRLDGSRTLEISRPLEAPQPFGGCVAAGVPGEVPCEGALEHASAFFAGASEDGSRVFFMTRQPLTGDDQDAGNDLYVATIGRPVAEPGCAVAKREVISLAQVSHDPVPDEAAEVQGIVKLAPDGSHVYFVARGVLTGEPGPEGRTAARGADNLYVYDSQTGGTAFVADLCSGPVASGVAIDSRCPGNLEAGGSRSDGRLWKVASTEAQTNGCLEVTAGCQTGSFLVFSSYGQLVSGDRDDAKDVYRYDAESGTLMRVSAGEDGGDADGNDSAFDATIALGHIGTGAPVVLQQEMQTRAISEDGSRIVFESAGPLSADATNGVANVYEWDEGSVSLISSGTAEEADKEAAISPSGRDVFFNTTAGLVSQDTQGDRDIYDARLEGGFPEAPASRQPCSGDACQGPLTNPAPLLVPGSVPQAPGGNFPPPTPAVKTKKAKAKKVKSKKAKKAKTKKAKQAHRENGRASGRSTRATVTIRGSGR